MKTKSLSMRRSIEFFIVVTAIVITVGTAGGGENIKKVRLAYAGWEVGTAVAYVAFDSGIFKKHELQVEEVLIRDTLSAGVQSLVGVDLLIGFGNPLAILQPVLNGADVTLFGSNVSFDHYGMGVAASVSAIKELKGKKVGVAALGSRSDLVARVLLRRAGLDPVKDVEVVAAGMSPARALAVSQNLVQGAPLRAETASEAKKLGIRILDVKAVPVVTDLLMTTRSFIKREEETVRRFMKAYAVATHHFVTHREESIAILKKYLTGAQAGSVEMIYNNIAAQLRPLPELNLESIQALMDVAAVVDQRTKSLKPADLMDQRFIEELKGSKFLKDLYTEKVSL